MVTRDAAGGRLGLFRPVRCIRRSVGGPIVGHGPWCPTSATGTFRGYRVGDLRARFDIVGFDPRGIICSTPLRCFDTFEGSLSGWPPFAFPVTPAEENVQRDADQALASACAQHGGPILNHMSTADVAKAHMADLQNQGRYDVRYLRYRVDEHEGKVFCLVEAPSAHAAVTVHREAHGLLADDVFQVQRAPDRRHALARRDELTRR